MSIEILSSKSRDEWLGLRKSTIGASEAATMLGVNPWATPLELWALKSGRIDPSEENKAMRRGRRLEPLAIDILREERPEWIVEPNMIPGGKFYRDMEAGISCTPDAIVGDQRRTSFGICQIKTVDAHAFRERWYVDGCIEVPVYVAIQAMQEAYLTGAEWCCVEAIVGFDLDVHIIDVPIHAGVIERIRAAAPEFLRRIRENDPPEPDYGRDGDVINALYPEDDGGTVDLSGNERIAKLAGRHLALKEIESAANAAERERRIIDPQIIEALGNAQCGTINGFMIKAKTLRRNYKSREAHSTSSRPLKITRIGI